MREIFDQLSTGIKVLITRQVWVNNGSPLDRGDHFGEDLLRQDPLEESVRAAFRTAFNENLQEVNEYPNVGFVKMALSVFNAFEVTRTWIRSWFQHAPTQDSLLSRNLTMIPNSANPTLAT